METEEGWNGDGIGLDSMAGLTGLGLLAGLTGRPITQTRLKNSFEHFGHDNATTSWVAWIRLGLGLDEAWPRLAWEPGLCLDYAWPMLGLCLVQDEAWIKLGSSFD